MRIKLSEERRTQLLDAVTRYFEDNFDEPLSAFKASELLNFFVQELGPPVYNQGVRDACSFVQDRLGDIEGEIHEPERR